MRHTPQQRPNFRATMMRSSLLTLETSAQSNECEDVGEETLEIQ